MSASLVGSEMCIRDRSCGGAHIPSSGCLFGLLRELADDLAHPPTQPPNRCLLYTSDAADDM
eukprot:4602344-Alexandrium_andersonii.AAC.1